MTQAKWRTAATFVPLLGGTVLLAHVSLASGPTADKPNVVLISVSALRPDRLSGYGHGRPTSPNIDALAEDGVAFDLAFSPSHTPTEALASLLTGTLPAKLGFTSGAALLTPQPRTVPQWFHDHGWFTAGIVQANEELPTFFSDGFDDWRARYGDGRAADTLREAEQFLADHGNQPFFLWLRFTDPAQPFNQPSPYESFYNHPRTLQRFGLTLPFAVPDDGAVPNCAGCRTQGAPSSVFMTLTRDLYDGEIAYLDDVLGELFERLRERHLYDNTIIAFVGEYGEMLWERGGYGHHGPHLSDELLRVPLIIKSHVSNGARTTGKRVTSLVRSYDLAPTLLDLVGLNEREDDNGTVNSGRTLLPHLAIGRQAIVEELPVVAEDTAHHMVSVRDRNMKYVLSLPPNQVPREQLFDLSMDPQERRNVSRQHPEALRKHRFSALKHAIKNNNGSYLLVTGDGRKRKYSVRVNTREPIRNVRSLHGLRVRKQSTTHVTFEGTATSELLLVAQFDSPSALFNIEVSHRGKHMRMAPHQQTYDDVVLDNLLASNQLDVHLLTVAAVETYPASAHLESRTP